MNLDELRAQLADLDGELLALVAHRLRLGAGIGRIKQQQNLGTRDFAQEAQVIRRAHATAAQVGLPPAVAEELMLTLIRASLTVQEQDRVAAQSAQGDGKRALVIGGAGKMGRWMVRFLASQGWDVEVADPAGAVEGHRHCGDWRASALDHDAIVVAASLRISNDILLELAVRKPPGVVFDVGSLKSPLRAGLEALVAAGVKVTSIHPMFGPDTELLSGRHVITVDLGSVAANDVTRRLFSATMAKQIWMTLDDHDRLIAYVLGLSHALNIAFFTALAESGATAPSLANMSSTTFDAQLAVAAAVAAENPHLYFEIQSLNEYGVEALDALLSAVDRLRTIVRTGDEESFAVLMRRGYEYLSERRHPQRMDG